VRAVAQLTVDAPIRNRVAHALPVFVIVDEPVEDSTHLQIGVPPLAHVERAGEPDARLFT
jgi:hypothetical protein